MVAGKYAVMLFVKLWWHLKGGWGLGHESGGQTQARDDQEIRNGVDSDYLYVTLRIPLRNGTTSRPSLADATYSGKTALFF